MEAKIIGTGSWVPEHVVSNEDLSQMLDTSDEWIRSRTGIEKRRISLDQKASDMAVKAAERALNNARCNPEELEAIIVATSSPDYTFPNTASIVQSQLKAVNAFCFDLSAACTGFIYGLNIANAYIKSGLYQKVLVIGSEVMSTEVDWHDRKVCVLFGDGAGAVVVGAQEEGKGIMNCQIHTDGTLGKALTYNGIYERLGYGNQSQAQAVEQKVIGQSELPRSPYIAMDGQEVFRFAVKKVPESIQQVLAEQGMKPEQVKYYLLHQANIRIIQSVAKRLHLTMDQFPVNLQQYGNTSAASIPILLDECNRQGRLQKGDRIILSGFGAGLSWGSILMEW